MGVSKQFQLISAKIADYTFNSLELHSNFDCNSFTSDISVMLVSCYSEFSQNIGIFTSLKKDMDHRSIKLDLGCKKTK